MINKKNIAIIAIASIFGLALSLVGRQAFLVQPLSAEKMAFEEQEATVRAIKKVSPAVVSISIFESQDGIKRSMGAGTGFLISADGLIITNKHVIGVADEKKAEYKIYLNSGKQYYAQFIGKDPLNDLALLKIFDKNLPFVELGDSDKLTQGISVIAIGNALGIYQNSVTKGIVSGLNRNIIAGDNGGTFETLGNVIQTDAQINLGNSGGPLVDLNGKVVGVSVAVDSSGLAISFAIPINDVKPVIKSAKDIGRIVRPRLGVMYLMVTPELVQEKHLSRANGAWINSDQEEISPITAGSPAAKANLQAGDIIFEVNGVKIDQKNTLITTLQKYQPGNKITLKIQRGNSIITKVVELDEFK